MLPEAPWYQPSRQPSPGLRITGWTAASTGDPLPHRWCWANRSWRPTRVTHRRWRLVARSSGPAPSGPPPPASVASTGRRSVVRRQPGPGRWWSAYAGPRSQGRRSVHRTWPKHPEGGRRTERRRRPRQPTAGWDCGVRYWPTPARSRPSMRARATTGACLRQRPFSFASAIYGLGSSFRPIDNVLESRPTLRMPLDPALHQPKREGGGCSLKVAGGIRRGRGRPGHESAIKQSSLCNLTAITP